MGGVEKGGTNICINALKGGQNLHFPKIEEFTRFCRESLSQIFFALRALNIHLHC